MNQSMMKYQGSKLPCRLFLLLSFLVALPGVSSLPTFQQRIPNGDKVVAPSGQPWAGVGHFRAAGGGERNRFGLDFAEAGFRWTVELCRKDSDCDGLTNGQELGDPECIWKEGDIPQFDTGITHPGIADTERNGGAAVTASGLVNTASPADTCDSFSFESLPSQYTNTSFLMPNYLVPTERTTYVKYAFKVDFDNQDSFAVRFEAILDNPEVVHHMILYQCDTEPTNFIDSPSTRGRMPCTNLVSAWAVGGKPQCLPSKVGIELDSSKPWYVIDMHYDNPRGLSDIRDNSGLLITTFPKTSLSQEESKEFQAAGWLWAGAVPFGISIPPGRSDFEITARCNYHSIPEEGVTVFSYALHAHQIGRKIWTEVKRATGNTRRRFLKNSADDATRALRNPNCPSRCLPACEACFSEDVCCGKLDPTICDPSSGYCCNACQVCMGCQGCHDHHATCNPLGGEYSVNFSELETVHDLACDTKYDFDLQEVRNLHEYQTLYSTDVLETHCVYDSTGRTTVTQGGDETIDEMCIAFFLYYPVQPFSMTCMTTNIELDVKSEGEHICNMPGQDRVFVDDVLCPNNREGQNSAAVVGFASLPTWLKLHILCLMAGIGILIPVGVLIPMSFRSVLHSNDSWFKYHRILQSIGCLLMTVGVGLAFANVSSLSHLTVAHHRLGLAVFVIVLLQPINAMLRPHKTGKKMDEIKGEVETLPEDAPSFKRKSWEAGHKTAGRFAVLAAFVNIFLGIQLLSDWYGGSDSMISTLIGVQSTVIALLVVGAIIGGFRSRSTE